MPNFDQTGPRGEGPATGRRRGKCAGGFGRGMQGGFPGGGRGFGRGFGRGREFSPEEYREFLESELKLLDSEKS